MNDLLYSPIHTVLDRHIPITVREVIQFDPASVYSRIKIDPYKRHQNLCMETMFPNLQPGYCACGCGKKLTGRQTRWGSINCSIVPARIFRIIQGHGDAIRNVITWFHDFTCCKCGCENSLNKNFVSNLQVDHIVAVINGGGGCWLGNYQILCNRCHGQKTGIDKMTRNRPEPLQPSALFNY